MSLDRKQLLLDLMGHEDYKPMKIRDIATLLQLTKEEKKALDTVLQDLIKEGKVVLTKRGKYMLGEEKGYMVGRFIAHEKGFGFVEVEGEDDDIFIPGKYRGTAFHHDTVAIKLLPESRGQRKEGQVMEVTQRGKETLVGSYEPGEGFGFVVPDNKKMTQHIFIPRGKQRAAMKGHKVVVRIKDWGGDDKKPEGEVIEIIGHIDDPETAILAIVKNHDIPTEFPQEVKDQVATIPTSVDAAMTEGRLDIRDLQTVTIDGADAKDLDDAITLEKSGENYKLGVHIADVTHYVKEGSPMDEEALNRSTSVYLVDRVIPMLPRQLSNGICSLNAGVDRLALSCMMTIDGAGNVVDYNIAETVIHVDERMTYSDVADIVSHQDPALSKRYSPLVPMFDHMLALAHVLRSKRKMRGSIDFNFPEAKVKLDDEGGVVDIHVYDRNEATKIIEEFMLLANEVVAEHHYWQEVPFVYRNHEEPDKDRLKALSRFIYNFGYHIKGKEDVHPKAIQKLLIDIEGSDEETLISRLALRSMKQAKYEADCQGHFGLAANYYSHFTSPIRRYPDLQIHRIIKEILHGGLTAERENRYRRLLPDITKQNSQNERRAEQAERETIKLKKVEYMERHMGEVFTGVISGTTKWGMYVELPSTVEGLIHVSAMTDDYYRFDDKNYLYVGERTGKTYALGDRVDVKVEGCNREERTIDFSIAEPNEG